MLLSNLYKRRGVLKLRRAKLELQIEARQLELTPVAGWEGKNADARALNERKTYADDAVLASLEKSLERTKHYEIINAARIDAEEESRRSNEHRIYAQMATALSGLRNHTTAPAFGQSAVRDTAKYATAEEIIREAAKAIDDIGNDDMPF